MGYVDRSFSTATLEVDRECRVPVDSTSCTRVIHTLYKKMYVSRSSGCLRRYWDIDAILAEETSVPAKTLVTLAAFLSLLSFLEALGSLVPKTRMDRATSVRRSCVQAAHGLRPPLNNSEMDYKHNL